MNSIVVFRVDFLHNIEQLKGDLMEKRDNIYPLRVEFDGPGWYAGEQIFEEFLIQRVWKDKEDREGAEKQARFLRQGPVCWLGSQEEANALELLANSVIETIKEE